MTTEQKIIRAKVGLLELAKQLGNVSQACKMMGYSRDSFRTPNPAAQPGADCQNGSQLLQHSRIALRNLRTMR